MQHGDKRFCGVATVGTKGQIVIPIEARDDIGLNPGDKVFVISMKEKKMLAVFPAGSMEAFVEEMTSQLSNLKRALKKGKKD